MKLFKTVDDRLSALGYAKVEDTQNIVLYIKQEVNPSYAHEVALLHKASGRHILQSYDPKLGDDKGIGNTCSGLTYTELRLFAKKMRQKGWT